jgi:hypothetical protein
MLTIAHELLTQNVRLQKESATKYSGPKFVNSKIGTFYSLVVASRGLPLKWQANFPLACRMTLLTNRCVFVMDLYIEAAMLLNK